MQKLLLLFMSFNSLVLANGVIVEKNLGNCTAEINAWGQSVVCSCRDSYKYDARSGYCQLIGSGKEDVLVPGILQLKQNNNEIILLSYAGDKFELILKLNEKKHIYPRHTGLPAEVSGERIYIPQGEGLRSAIIAHEFFILE